MKYREHNDGVTTGPEIQTVGKAFDDCLANTREHLWKRIRIVYNSLSHDPLQREMPDPNLAAPAHTNHSPHRILVWPADEKPDCGS
jgi:hypothetical protein